jgi:hypothetical protein
MELLLALALNAPLEPTFDIVDSRDDQSITYIIYNNTCKVRLKKDDLKNTDLVAKKVEEVCGIYSLSR